MIQSKQNSTVSTSKSWLCHTKYLEFRQKTPVTPNYGNLYHYAGNNPVRYTDPDGRSPFEQQLYNYFVNQTLSNEPFMETDLFTSSINSMNEQFVFQFEKIQRNMEKGIVAGARFVSDYGSIISLVCYATGNVELGIVIDGVTLVLDVTLAIADYQNSEKTKNDKIKLGTDITTSVVSTFGAGNVGEVATKGLKKLGQEEFNKKLTNMLSNIIGREFDVCIDSFVEETLE